jgi:FKBP-type peptidyl-prolyl cis-trans isomerase 2
VLGSGQFIPGFEDQLIGVKAGEERELNVTFPADYPDAKLAGKDAVFTAKVKESRSPIRWSSTTSSPRSSASIRWRRSKTACANS